MNTEQPTQATEARQRVTGRRSVPVSIAIVMAAAGAVAAAGSVLAAGAAGGPDEAAVMTETVTETVTETETDRVQVEVEPSWWQSCQDLADLNDWTYDDAHSAGEVFEDTDDKDFTPGEGCAVLWSGQVLDGGE